MNFSNKKVHTQIQLKLLDLVAAGNSIFYAASLVKQVAVPPIRLAHGSSSDVQTLKEASGAKAQDLFGSLILLPLPEKVQEFLAKSAPKPNAKKDIEVPIKSTVHLAVDSISIDKRNNLVINAYAEVTPAFLNFKPFALIEELEIDTGLKLALLNETSPFLNVSISHLKGQESNNVTTLEFQMSMAFTKGKVAIKSREDFIRTVMGKTVSSLSPYFSLSAISSSNLENSECSWCQSIQAFPFPFPLEDYVEQWNEALKNGTFRIKKGVFKKFKKRLLRKLKEADRELSFEIIKEDEIVINLKLKSEELPTYFKLGCISTDLFYNSDLFAHIDMSLVSEKDYLDVTLRLQKLKMELIQSIIPKFLGAYLLDIKIPTDNEFTLSNLRIGTSSDDTVLVLRKLLRGSFELKKIYSQIQPFLPKKDKWTEKLGFLDFSQYSSTELPISLLSFEDNAIAVKFQLFLNKKGLIQKVEKVFFSAKLTLDDKEVAEFEIENLTYDRSTSKLEFILRLRFFSNLQTLKTWALAWGAALKGDTALNPGVRELKYGETKETAKPILEEITPDWILAHIFPVLPEKYSHFSSFINDKLGQQQSENENIQLKDETTKLLVKREVEPTTVHNGDSAFKALTSSTNFWKRTFMEEMGLSKSNEPSNTACFASGDKPVQLTFPSKSMVSIALRKCQTFTSPFRMWLFEIKLNPLLNSEALGAIIVKDGYISTSSDQLVVEIDIEFDFTKEKIQKNIINLLDSLSSHLEQDRSLLDFQPIHLDIEFEGGVKIEPKPLTLFQPPSTEEVQTSSALSLPELELGPLQLKLDSKGFQLELEILYPTLPYQFSYSIDAFGFFIYREKKPLLQFELGIPQITNNALSLKLQLMPIKENVALLPEVLEQLMSRKIELNTLSISNWYFGTPPVEDENTRPHYPFTPKLFKTKRFGSSSSSLFTNWESIKSEYGKEEKKLLILNGAKLLLYKHPNHSIKVPYFRLNVTQTDGSWLQVASLDDGINVVSGQKYVVLMVTTDSMELLSLLAQVTKFESITDLTFGDSKESTLAWIEKTPFLIKRALPSLKADPSESLPIESGKLTAENHPDRRKMGSNDVLVRRSNIKKYFTKRDLTSQQDDEFGLFEDDFKFKDEDDEEKELDALFKANPQEKIPGPEPNLKSVSLSNDMINGKEQKKLVQLENKDKKVVVPKKDITQGIRSDAEEDKIDKADFSFNDENEEEEVPEVSWSALKAETEKVWPTLPEEVKENPLKIHISGRII